MAPDNPAALLGLGVALAAAGDHAAAIQAYRRAIAAKPSEPFAWANLGFALENLERLADAEAAYRRRSPSPRDWASPR